MLVKELVKYARRTFDEAPRYYRSRSIRWALMIDSNGGVRLSELAEDGKHGKEMATPYLARTSGIAPMLLCDSLEYVLCLPKDDTEKAEAGAIKRNDAFVALLRAWRDASDDPVADRIWEVFESGRHLSVEVSEDCRPKAKASDNVAIFIDGGYAHDLPSAQRLWARIAKDRKSSGNEGLCLSCGEIGPLLKTVPEMVKSTLIPVGVDSGGRPKRGRDAALISVNTAAQGRQGILQLVNTPLCEDCGAGAMAALNGLLADRRHSRRGIDNAFVWWLRDDASDVDPFIIEKPTLEDVRALLSSVHLAKTGVQVDHDAFYSVTLSANQSRVVVRDWLELPVGQIKEKLADWFDDHRSSDVRGDGDEHYVPLWMMVRAAGRWDGKAGRYVPGSSIDGLERGLLRCAFDGVPTPPQLVPHLLHRIRNDHHIDLSRVGILRLALRRMPGIRDDAQEKEKIMPGLNESETHPGYVWGRVFAVLEEIQRQAIPNLNASIRDRYFGLAMAQPAPTYRQLRLNANGHLKKLIGRQPTRSAGYALSLRLGEITNLFDSTGLPTALDSDGQVRFILGYEHQRAADAEARRAAAAAKAARTSNDDTPKEP